mgnify:FL=1
MPSTDRGSAGALPEGRQADVTLGQMKRLWFGLALMTAACGPEGNGQASQDEEALIAIGDSIMDFNPGEDVADVVGVELGFEVDDLSVAGSAMLSIGPDAIPSQYVPGGGYRLLVATGGGNDLQSDTDPCTCGSDCSSTIDRLITTDSSAGAIPKLIEQVVSDGTRVAWIGYMIPLPTADAFSDCIGEFKVLADRLRTLDARLEQMVFVDGAQVGTGTEAELYADDGYHPSPAGSEALGRSVAARVTAEFRE